MTTDKFAIGTLIQLTFENAGGEVQDDICAKVTGVSDNGIGLITIEGVHGTMVVGGKSIEPGTLLVFRFGSYPSEGPSAWSQEVVVVGIVTAVRDAQVRMMTYRCAGGCMDVGGECIRPLDAYLNPFGENTEH
jgi:hypothetical protein